MEISANFAFLEQEFPFVAESASYAERHVYADPRASCFHARHALERLLVRLYKVEKTLRFRRPFMLGERFHLASQTSIF